DADAATWISAGEATLFDADALVGTRSSTVNVASGDAEDGDNDDNGIAAGSDVLSAVVTLGDGVGLGATEPVDEQLRSNDATDDDPDAGWAAGSDAHSNFSVDFGFSPLMRVGSTVWLDNGAGTVANAENGVLDAGE